MHLSEQLDFSLRYLLIKKLQKAILVNVSFCFDFRPQIHHTIPYIAANGVANIVALATTVSHIWGIFMVHT